MNNQIAQGLIQRLSEVPMGESARKLSRVIILEYFSQFDIKPEDQPETPEEE